MWAAAVLGVHDPSIFFPLFSAAAKLSHLFNAQDTVHTLFAIATLGLIDPVSVNPILNMTKKVAASFSVGESVQVILYARPQLFIMHSEDLILLGVGFPNLLFFFFFF